MILVPMIQHVHKKVVSKSADNVWRKHVAHKLGKPKSRQLPVSVVIHGRLQCKSDYGSMPGSIGIVSGSH